MQDNCPIVSIIVPIHNAEQYLQKCLSSVKSQVFSNFECLLVNDGSADRSGLISQDFCKADSRFRLFNNEWHGVSAARNFGLSKAIGKYILFLDSDDWLQDNAIAQAISIAQNSQADIIQWNFIDEYPNISCKRKNYPVGNFKPENNTNLFTGFVTTALFSHELIVKNNIFFEEGLNIGEDILFSLKCFIHSKQNYFINKYLSHYRLNKFGISHNVSCQSIINFEHVFKCFEKSLSNTQLKQYSPVLCKIKLIIKKMLLVTVPKPRYDLFYQVFPEINGNLPKVKGLAGIVFKLIKFRFYFFVSIAIKILKKTNVRYY